MRSALYYPHTKIQSEGLFKTALMLWDEVRIIAPWPGYSPDYHSETQNAAFELIGRCHYPTDYEKNQAHRLVEDFATRSLPDSFSYREISPATDIYELYAEKLLPKTWDLLQDVGLAGKGGRRRGYTTANQTGLSLMSLLADCCAGKTFLRVTDKGAAYAGLAGLLTAADDPAFETGKARQTLLPVAMSVADVQGLPLESWVALRKRERSTSEGHAIRELRHRFMEATEHQAEALGAAVSESDRWEIRRQFEEDMSDDYRALREALKLESHQILGTKEMITTVVGFAGAMLEISRPLLPMPELMTAAGAAVMVGGLMAARGKFLLSRRKLLREHPMAYLYEARGGPRL